jgi:hypothetical protein
MSEDDVSWSLPRRFALGFAAAFIVFSMWPPFFLPNFASILSLDPIWLAVARWAARTFLGVAQLDVTPNGSGDKLVNYLQLAIFVVLGILGGIAWSFIGRPARRSAKLYELLRIYTRFALASVLAVYGFDKLIQLQFPKPSLERLVEPYGASSPMGILWTFMGVSRAYNFLTGFAELAAGVLLTMRRTTLAGALLAMAVMGNIMALNFCYDVPVKIFSTELFLMAAFLALPDAKRLVDFFVRHPQRPLFERRWPHLTSMSLRTLAVIAVLYWGFRDATAARTLYGDRAPRSPLRGIWNVDELTENGVARPPLFTDATRWRRVIFDGPRSSSIYLADDSRLRFAAEVDAQKKTIKLTTREVPKKAFTLTYARPLPQTLVLDGAAEGKTIHAVCHLADEKSWLLLTRGFHWISEAPFNR